MPKISVIIPVYKVEKYLPACLDSVLAQKFTDWEAICVNDGSPDNCAKILQEYAEKDKRIKVITQKNQGVSSARNSGLDQITGDFICFLDSDDELSPNFLEKMYDALQKTNADVAWCNLQQGSKKKDWQIKKIPVQVYANVFERFLQENPKMVMFLGNKVFRKDLIASKRFCRDLSIAEDLLFLYEVMYESKKVCHVPEILCWYRARESSVMHEDFSKKVIDGNCGAAVAMFYYFKDKVMPPKTRKILHQKIMKRIFKFCVLEPKRKDNKNVDNWYSVTRPLLGELKAKGIYQPQHLTLKNQLKSWWFLKEGRDD